MFGWFKKQEALREAVEEAVYAVWWDAEKRAAEDVQGMTTVQQLQSTITGLREEIEMLRISKARKEEEAEKREREIEHKVGLHRKQVASETEIASRKARLEVREENLTERQKAFEERMEFIQERMEAEVKDNRVLLEKMLERLPTAEILAEIGGVNRE